MKKFYLTTLIVLFVSSLSTFAHVVAKGQSNTPFGDYTVTQLDDHFLLNNKELDKYLISYEKSNIQVVVAIDKQKKCKKYYVLTEKLPIQYECNGTYFGIKKLDKELVAAGYNTVVEKMNRAEFYNQRVLTSETTATVDHLHLIASYYPGLFKENAA